MSVNYSKPISEAIEAFFVEDNWKYDPINERGIFRTNMTLHSRVQHINIYVNVRDDTFSIESILPFNADEDSRPAIAEYLTRANYGLLHGNFEMDFEDGEIRYKTVHYCPDENPTMEEVRKMMYTNIAMVKRYGDNMVKVMFGMMTPKEAVEDAEGD